jgi:raffinose/stachyose/melibiose transport system substrate-binding protein
MGRVIGCTAALALILGVQSAFAQTTVNWLHIEQNPEVVAFWEERAREFEDKNPGVTIEMSYLENQAFKAKLTTMLQSEDRPDLFYSWGGGVFHAQADAGVLRDISGLMDDEWAATFNPAAIEAFQYEDAVYGAPMLTSQVVFWYNKELMDQAGVDPDSIETWDDFLGAVQQIKDAGITPLVAGGADKWPLHFYWTHLAIRLGGREAFEAATSGEGDGFAGETFVKAGELMQQLTSMEPFQDGYLAHTNEQASGMFGDGDAAMYFNGNWLYNIQRVWAEDGEGLSEERLGFFTFPMVEGGKGEPSDTLGGINGWLVGKDAPDEAVAFLRYLLSPEHETEMARRGFFIPVVKGADAEMTNPFFKEIAGNIAGSGYHQIFYDQMLGPAVGLVVNDVSADLAAGNTTPEEAARTVQDAWEFENF